MGNTGGIVVETENSFQLNQLLENFSLSDRTLINRILNLGFHFKVISQFVQQAETDIILEVVKLQKRKAGLGGMEIEEEEEELKGLNNAVLRKLSLVFKKLLQIYFQKVDQVETEYLNGKIVTLPSFQQNFQEYFDLFPECVAIIRKSKATQSASELLDSILESKMNSITHVKQLYSNLFDSLFELFYEDLKKWITYGKTSSGFFIKKMRGKNQMQEDWDNDFLIQVSLLPKNILSMKTANKILFIGKAMRILLRQQNLMSEGFRNVTERLLQLIPYDTLRFNRTIEEIKGEVSRQFIEFILSKGKIFNEVEAICQIYLLCNDDFYKMFIEESLELLFSAEGQSETEINNRGYQNTLLRMNKSSKEEPWNLLKFVQKSQGFNYANFNVLQNLQMFGDVEKVKENLKLNSSEPQSSLPNSKTSLWNLIKHEVDKSFQLDLKFKFKKNNRHFVQKISESSGPGKTYVLSIVLQSFSDVKGYKKNKELLNLSYLESYLTINFGFYDHNTLYQSTGKNLVSFVSLIYKQQKNTPPKTLFEKQFQKDG